MVLHKLNLVLRRLGFSSWITIWPWMAHQSYESNSEDSQLTRDQINPETDIAIYPEVIKGNPLGVKRCVRWILSDPGRNSADFRASWGDSDLIVYYGSYTSRDLSIRISHSMFLVTYARPRLDVKTGANEDRKVECHIIRKAQRFDVKPTGLHTSNSVLLDTCCRSTEDYISYFRKSSKVVSYDPFTFHSILAALHGSQSIVKPLPSLTLQEWSSATCISANSLISDLGEGGIPGVAYGLDDLARAERTRNNVERWLELQVAEGIESVRRFANLALAYWS